MVHKRQPMDQIAAGARDRVSTVRNERNGRSCGKCGNACSRSSSSTAVSHWRARHSSRSFRWSSSFPRSCRQGIRDSILSTMTHRLGIEGDALVTAKQAFASSNDIRRATGILGLVFTFFFATSFTTALQRVYLRAWRRPPARNKARAYVRGPSWFLVVLANMALLGGLRALFGDGPQLVVFAVVALAATSSLWWFTAWFMLMGQVRWRVLVPTGVVTAVALAGFAISATVWMPNVVTRNETQFGFFGVSLALVTWFSGAAICVLLGACVGSVFAGDTGRVGAFIRGPESSLLMEGAEPSFPAPERAPRLSEAFRPTEDETGPS